MPIADFRNGVRHLSIRYYLPSVLATTGTMMLVPTLPLYLQRQTESLTLVSVVLAASAIGGTLWNIPAGSTVGRFGERVGFLGGITAGAAGTAAIGLGGGLWLPMLACALAGAGQSSRLLSRQSYARRVIAANVRGRLMSIYGGLGRVAVLLGPLLGGFLGESVGLRPTFAIAGLLMFSSVVPPLFAGPGADGRPAPGDRPVRLGIKMMLTLHGRVIGIAGLGQLGAAMVRVGRLTVVPLYGEAIGLDLSDIGIVVAIAGGLDLLLFPLAGWLMDNFGRLYAIVPSFTLMAIGLVALPLADSFWTLSLVALFVGFGNGIGSGTMLTLSTDLAPADSAAEFLGLVRLLADAGRILGPISVGLVADRLGLGASGVTLGIVALATAALFAFAIGDTAGGGLRGSR